MTVDAASNDPDADLLAYVLISAATVDALAPVAASVEDLARARSIRLLDAVILDRPADRITVQVTSIDRFGALAALCRRTESPVLLSAHDIELSSLTLGPDQAALLLLLEDLWAHPLAVMARASGGRVSAGERITRERVLASLDPDPAADGADRGRRANLLPRGPGTAPVGDPVEQLHELARLVERNLLSADLYDVQRRRVLGG